MNATYQQFIGYSLRYERLKANLSLRMLAEKCKVSHTVIANIEKGKTPLSASLNVGFDNLFDWNFKEDLESFEFLQETIQAIFNAVLFHDENVLRNIRMSLKDSDRFKKSGLIFIRDLIDHIVLIHDYQEVHHVALNQIHIFEKMLDDLPPSLQYLLNLSIALYDRYHFKLSQAKKRLMSLSNTYLNPHHKALVYDRLSDVFYHTFDRSKAIQNASEANQIYQTFHNTNRAVLSEIKMQLYGKRQHQKETELAYQQWIEQAQIYKLTEVINDIHYVHALRVFRFNRFDEAIQLLQNLDLSHPQFYHYYVIVLFGSKRFETLKTFFKEQRLSAPMIEAFSPAVNYVKAYLDEADDKVLEIELNHYLEITLKEELYGESRWAETLWMDYLLSRRRYKEATLLKERLIDLILT
jgi:transcriptional regulator with XRE-family HTH domain